MPDRPLRIAFLLPTFPELSNTFILAQITGLIDRGHGVDLFALERKSFERAQPDVAAYALSERMRHLPVPRGRWPRLRSTIAVLLSAEGRHPAVLDGLNPRRHGRGAWSTVQLHTAASFLRAGAYDVLHCQFGHLGPAAERLVALGAVGAKLVTSFRGADLTVHVPADPARYAELFRRGDLFLPVSRDFAERLAAVGVPGDRIQVQHSGIDLERFPFAPRTAPAGRPELLFVGRLAEKKGVTYALEALALLREGGRDADLTIVGDGPLAPTLRKRAGELGLTERVTFAGRLAQGEVVAAMRRAHVLLAPSVTAPNGDQEGIPNVAKEAMATGMPVVATWHSGVPELVEHGVSGLLAPERDAPALAQHLAWLCDHPERWAEMGRAGRDRVEAEFGAERLNDLLVERYRAVVGIDVGESGD